MEKGTNVNTEEAILKAAEEVFLEKGFTGAKTTEIARRAGVNHAMLHYYFRTKENLFSLIFRNKIGVLAVSLDDAFNQDLPFLEKVKLAIETHFDFVRANPRLLFFIFTEAANNKERRSQLKKITAPVILSVLRRVRKDLDEEVNKGAIRPIEPIELLLNIVSLNVITFVANPILHELESEKESIEQIFQNRKASNVAFVINALKA